tara:strand:+ start:394 stop:750 length:357 start_codon:yes stop_codon:yes gene_type:complete
MKITKNPFKGKVATTVIDLSDKNGKRTGVQYHDTIIVEFTDHEVKLNATDPDGESWLTPTTKLRMNQISEQYDLGFNVYQKYGSWWVEPKSPAHSSKPQKRRGTGPMMPFVDNMTIKR